MAMSDAHPLREVIDKYNNAWNRHDVDAIVAMHTDDSVFCNHTSGGEAVGLEAIRRVVSSVFRTFPDIHFELRRLYVRDDLVVQEWTASATHRNPVKYKDMMLQPTGKTVRWNGMDVIPMRDSLVARKDVYADSVSYLRQLGAPL
jgi:steroid delta-isomerase-like uncharacterized protein